MIPGVQNDRYPIVNIGDQTPLVVKSVTLQVVNGHYPTLTLPEPAQGSSGRSLYITDGASVSLDAGTTVWLDTGCDLTLGGDGYLTTIRLEGDIVFKDVGTGGGEGSPGIRLAPKDDNSSAVFVTYGSGRIRGEISGEITPGSIPGNNPPDPSRIVLVLGEGNAIYGSIESNVLLVNNGVVDPYEPVTGTPGRTLTLWCEPKGGSGLWSVTGGASGSGNENTMIIRSNLTGTGDILIGEYGKLIVKRNVSVLGTFEMREHADILIDKDVLFEAHRFIQVCSYSP